VIDNKTVITGSFNWSPAAAHTNDETLLIIHSPKLAEHFTREMNRMWRSAELGITLTYSLTPICSYHPLLT
jgi:phosphatidylserine/phosphatidylglycerophosphate/cardiolipin synthase-like enzyme